MGAIKKPTRSDFNPEKAGLMSLSDEFKWELGYLYTQPAHEGKGIGSNVVKFLLQIFGHGRLMASTEIAANPAMVKILERNGFRCYGKPWRSGIHDHFLGLFLKF
jgi:GNAT superfamily N-acetyltransferase